MSTRPRNRDLHPLLKGDAMPMAISASMQTSGWVGGQGLQWVDSSADEFRVTLSTGHFGGFALYGSSESADQFTALTGMQPKYGFTILCTGTWVIELRTFEKFTYASRQVGPLVPLAYQERDRLFFGLTGNFTKEDEWGLSGDPRAPNTFYAGTVVQAPNADGYMVVQTAT